MDVRGHWGLGGLVQNSNVDSVRRVFIQPDIKIILNQIKRLPRHYSQPLAKRIPTTCG